MKKAAKKKKSLFCIIDASSFIFRAYYAIAPLSTKNKLPTNATLGFANMMVKLIGDLSPSHIAIVYDNKYPSFRKKLYSEYKANRLSMPDDLIPQIPYIKKFVDCLSLSSFEEKGYEADDLIATLVELSKNSSIPSCIVSSDKDLMQLLIYKDTYMFDAMKNKEIYPKDVKEKLGVAPKNVTDYLALVGDASDNIPGVRGIGPKSAASLIGEWGSLEDIYKNIDKLKKGKQKETLEEHKDVAFLSKELSIVKKDLKLDFSWDALLCSPKYSKQMRDLCEELEFVKLSKRMEGILPEGEGSSSPGKAASTKEDRDEVRKAKPKYEAILSIENLKEVFKQLSKEKVIAIDTETTGLEHNASLVGFSFCASKKESFYVPLCHKNLKKQCDLKKSIALLKDFIKAKNLVGHNIKFDINIFFQHGLTINSDQILFDTMIASYMLVPESRHNMNTVSEKYLNHTCISFEEIMKQEKELESFADLSLENATKYACEDAHVTWMLHLKLDSLLKKDKNLKKVFYDIELPLIPVLAAMEREGVKIDTKFLKEMSFQLESEIGHLTNEAWRAAGEEFNLASPKQLQEILFKKLDIPTFNLKKKKTGYSTDVKSLTKLALYHELPSLMLLFREVNKLKNTYVDVIPSLVDKHSRVHTSFNQTITATGRLSSSNPNLQNIPIRSELGKKIRGAFVADKNNVLIGADYNQIELRILAFLSKDKALLDCFERGDDIHAATARKVFSIKGREVSSEERRRAKAINFGLLYGKTAFSLSEELGITRRDASDIIENYFRQYPSIKKFLDTLPEKARELGYAETLYGRKRHIDGINAKNTFIRNMAERMAVNTPIQGTAADIIKIAMNDLQDALEKNNFKAKIILQVHDELVLEAPESELEKVSHLLKKCMEGVGKKKGFPKIEVPLAVDLNIGKDWLSLK